MLDGSCVRLLTQAPITPATQVPVAFGGQPIQGELLGYPWKGPPGRARLGRQLDEGGGAGPIGWERALRRFHLPATSLSSRRPNCCEPARITELRIARERTWQRWLRAERASHWATGWGRQERRADQCRFPRCRWIDGEPKPLRRGMFCGRPMLAGESWCALHRGIVFREECRR